MNIDSSSSEQKIHHFGESLELSNSYENSVWWNDVYRIAFPSLESSVSVRKDGWAQRGGIDRVLTLSSGKTLTVDEKIRTKVWNDILLERWSDEGRQVPGWVQKPLACDFIAYAFVPISTCYLFPTLMLQRAWREEGRGWVKKYTEIRAKNNGYVTVSVGIPVDILLKAISDAMKICWIAEHTP